MNNIFKLLSEQKSITLDLLILNYNKFEEYGKNCLLSIINQRVDDKIKSYLLDNNSTDGSQLAIKNFLKYYAEVTFLQADKNLGFAGGMNYLAKHSKGDWMLLVNSDTYFPEGAINNLKRILERLPDNIVAVGPVTNAAGNEQNINLHGSQQEILKQASILIQDKLDVLFEVPRLDFFCVAIKRSIWEKLNGLDEVYERGYYEDFDFCVRLNNSGLKMAITEDVFVYHKGSATFSSDETQKKLIKKNKKIFVTKYPNQKLYHVRENNLNMLKNYNLLEKLDGKFKNLILFRKTRRIEFLNKNQPRGIVKRLIWNIMVSKYFKYKS